MTDNSEAEISRLRAEVSRLKNYEAAYNEWIEKTEWINSQATWAFPHLGLHRADILRKEIERLRAIEAER